MRIIILIKFEVIVIISSYSARACKRELNDHFHSVASWPWHHPTQSWSVLAVPHKWTPKEEQLVPPLTYIFYTEVRKFEPADFPTVPRSGC